MKNTTSTTTAHPVAIHIAASRQSWESAGFTVDHAGLVRLGELTIRLIGRDSSGRGGIVSWSFHGLSPQQDAIHGIPIAPAPSVSLDDVRLHPNGAVAVDTIVLQSPDVAETIRGLDALGIRPLRDTTSVRKGVRQVISPALAFGASVWR